MKNIKIRNVILYAVCPDCGTHIVTDEGSEEITIEDKTVYCGTCNKKLGVPQSAFTHIHSDFRKEDK
jgi:predicted Zn finger-like uncharacterized protein